MPDFAGVETGHRTPRPVPDFTGVEPGHMGVGEAGVLTAGVVRTA